MSVRYHNNVRCDYDPDGVGFAGLDRFGRVTDLHYRDPNDVTVHRYEYGYDLAGNRTHVRVTQAAGGGYSHDNDRSYLYDYDDLNRLILAEMGRLNGTASAIVDDPNVPLHRQYAWQLDSLGNWAGADYLGGTLPQNYTIYDDTDGDGLWDAAVGIEQEPTAANEVLAVHRNDGSGLESRTYVHDAAGNLVFDWDGDVTTQYLYSP